jgi:hypothetical protein
MIIEWTESGILPLCRKNFIFFNSVFDWIKCSNPLFEHYNTAPFLGERMY